ncbi:molybdopterin-dependent oxidoreductase [Nocardiopsis dassonvillei]|uniref:(2Fe-2S)-binding domain protein n=4 Tax=Nocardiopsis dassonvillei TaxID=2014 RepID=D7AUS1_NOCDD|nr:molybdopterin-dependent oxidoreductase [Nocardiopsis dassonvillei]ADH67651.1 (2Fe-2S)-binding domain protein [Nocardiopsis dassonvillei subsp. dassonvillei DSM 43111]VEI88041.1 4-hydroxybenzoyl-CoA reductase subunit alpha [Nocardiopsis dassonvillei]
MNVRVNGVSSPAPDSPDTTAAEHIRDRLGLTGTKIACGTGVCGACTVLVEGAPTASCLLPADRLEDREVTTVEGLGGDHPVQRAFAAHDGMQCGYCTPGFVVEASAFVDSWRAEHGDVRPGRDRVADALAGHLCRCGAYEGIFAAVDAACAGEFDTEPEQAPPRADALAKVTGRARFSADLAPEGTWEGVIVRSAHAHARVRAVDPGGARSAAARRPGPGQPVDPNPVFTDLLGEERTVRYVGQPIAAVAAPTAALARAAARAVRVDYEPLPSVLGVEEARAQDAPRVYPTRAERQAAPSNAEGPGLPGRWDGNTRGPTTVGWRGATAVRRLRTAAERRDPRLVAQEYTTAVQVHSPLEPHVCVASWDRDGSLTLRASTQAVSKVAQKAAERWKLSPERVHVLSEYVGGGFGAKAGLSVDMVAATELSRLAHAPVRVSFDRAEELTDAGHRPGTRTRVALLADDSGDLAALTVDSHGDGGVSVGSTTAVFGLLMYGRSPRRARDFDVVTHRPPGAPMRAPGGAPMSWAVEQAVDTMAHRLGEDPLSLRRRWDGNHRRRALYERAAALELWRERPRGARTGRFRRGVGVAASNWLYLMGPSAKVELSVRDGAVVVRSATQDIGTGIRTVLGEVVAERLGMSAADVRVEIGDSSSVHGTGSFGSRTTTSMGPAAADAADRLRAELREREPGVPASGPIPEHALKDALAAAEGVRVVGERGRDRRGALTPNMDDLAVGRGMTGAVHVMEVEVDTLLGRVRPTRCWAGLAVGRVYAERLARNQAEGAVVQGVGYALFEERRHDPATGVVLTDNLEDYRLPGMGDVPETEVHFHQEGFEHAAGAGVGLGEISLVGVAASVANAVHDATGWRPLDLPIRPDRLLEGLR